MSDKFTPGPWIAATDGLSVHLVTPEGLTGSAVCMLMTKSGAIYNHDANARLIAAAPAMYEALHWLMATRNSFSGIEIEDAVRLGNADSEARKEAIAKARAALALARGEA